ncbi:hypothetical protein WR25_09020 [Diploscapter pachys]|uniref:Immunoglobulin domain-containing protein n=1 Tax=Diploscapter pachys TaxID=2018661 RepID=A0A2A2M1J5_9BILA|nr:hypothetical protein WR25_09020 [Diploscapter pachys]
MRLKRKGHHEWLPFELPNGTICLFLLPFLVTLVAGQQVLRGKPPEFGKDDLPPKTIDVFEGQTVSLKCSSPNADRVAWISPVGRTSPLGELSFIASRNDSTDFRCLAANDFGTTTHVTRISVHCEFF